MPDKNDNNVVPLTEGSRDQAKPQQEDGYLSVRDLIAQKMTSQKGEQTVLDLFTKGILFPHKLGGETGRAKLTQRASAAIRLAAFEKLRTNSHTKAEIGATFKKVCGQDDDFILEQLKDGISISAITDDLVKRCRAILDRP